MKYNEFSIVEKKNKRRRGSRWAAYGPGPFGGYGYAAGYSGDGGVGEASYEGNLGMMELAKFFRVANETQKKLFKELLEKGKRGLAWKLVQDTTGTKLQGQEFSEDRTADVVFDTGERRRVRYIPTTKDIVDVIIRYYLKQGLKVIKVNDEEVEWDHTNEGWRDTLAGLALGAGVALGSGAAEANVEKIEVSKGDTVYSIAKAFGTTPQIIQKLNKLDKDFTIKPGQTIKVPAAEVIDIIDKPSKEKKAEPEKKKQTKINSGKTLTGTAHEAALTKAARDAGITNPIELAAFLAQTAHESHNFQSMVEYGSRSYFKQYEPIFRKDKKTGKIIIDPETKKYKNFNPKAHRLGNDTRGDGIKYKGRGYIQITGKDNYRRVGQRIGVDLVKNPELAEQPEIAAKIAIMYWKMRTQPNVDNFNDVRAVTKTINPGLKGLQDRKELFQDFKKFKLASR